MTMPAATSNGMSSGIGKVMNAGASATSAKPPNGVVAATRSPGLQPAARRRAASTTPAISVPGMNGRSGLIWYSPRVISQSTNPAPAACTSISDQPVAGRPARARPRAAGPAGPPVSWRTSARMAANLPEPERARARGRRRRRRCRGGRRGARGRRAARSARPRRAARSQAASSSGSDTIAEPFSGSPAAARTRAASATSCAPIASTPSSLDELERRRGADPAQPGGGEVEPPRVAGEAQRRAVDRRPRVLAGVPARVQRRKLGEPLRVAR